MPTYADVFMKIVNIIYDLGPVVAGAGFTLAVGAKEGLTTFAKGIAEIAVEEIRARNTLALIDRVALLKKLRDQTGNDGAALTILTMATKEADVLAAARSVAEALPANVNLDAADPMIIRAIAEEVRNTPEPESRALLALIMQKEFERPGSFSKRTIAVVHMLEAKELEAFRRLCRVVVTGTWGKEFLGIVRTGSPILLDMGLDYDDLRDLRDAGLVRVDAIDVPTPKGGLAIVYDKHIATLHGTRGDDRIVISTAELTRAGTELRGLISTRPVPGLLEEFAIDLVAENNFRRLRQRKPLLTCSINPLPPKKQKTRSKKTKSPHDS